MHALMLWRVLPVLTLTCGFAACGGLPNEPRGTSGRVPHDTTVAVASQTRVSGGSSGSAGISLGRPTRPGTAPAVPGPPAPSIGVTNLCRPSRPARDAAAPQNASPEITILNPSGAATGASALTLTVIGYGFELGSTVQWNGTTRSTTVVDAERLTVEVSALDLSTAGTVAISVLNPAAGAVSRPVGFSIQPGSGLLWRVTELVLNTQATYANPFADNSVTGTFFGPAGQQLSIPAFYDGGGVWRLRFAPTRVGTWHYQVNSTNTFDKGLHGVSGSLDVTASASDNPLYAHGGFLRVSGNHRYLTYTDGTPFFWLGDVWWFAPSSLLPIDGDTPAFKTLVDKRNAQHYSVLQWAFLDEGWGHEWCCGDNSTRTLAQQRRADPAYWQQVDRYFSYAQDHGLLPVFGFGWPPTDLTLEEWKFLWSYVMARYGATPVTFLITMEYNVNYDQQRVDTALALGQHIKDSDPYARAMTVHPWAIWVDQQQAWTQSWYDFAMVEGGHWSPPLVAQASSYRFAYNAVPTRPMVDAESAFEGILGYGGTPNQVVGPEQTRRAAYYSIQLGGFGFTYGAHGLWYPTQSETDNRYWNDWGTSPPWWIAMEQPAGGQMQYLRALYESVNWWELEPRYDSIEPVSGGVLQDWYQPRAKSIGDDVYLVWFPYGENPNDGFKLHLQAADQRTFTAKWFNPRTGSVSQAVSTLSCMASACNLPPRPNSEDWVLVLTKAQ